MMCAVPNRNSPCPCGSGRKFKHCCGAFIDQTAGVAAGAPSGDSLDSIMACALDAQRANDLVTAKRLYQQALVISPDNIDALHMLGVVHFCEGDLTSAENYVSAARKRCRQPIPIIEENFRLISEAANLSAETETIRSVLNAQETQRQIGLDPIGEVSVDAHTRIIAFYLPQFHRIPENDIWWGEGFTEWVNVKRAKPNFSGHYQPHEPGELGYYDLNDQQVLIRQAELAKQYGITGFCFYYYWFGGRRLLEMPVNRMLASGKPDISYCLCWANENWTRNWDGGNREILVEQHYSPSDAEAFIFSLLPHFKDQRYIRIGDQPLLMVYRLDLLPDPIGTLEIWRAVCRQQNLPPPYIVSMSSFGKTSDPRVLGADAGADFPPHGAAVSPSLRQGLEILEPAYDGLLADYLPMVAKFLTSPNRPYPYFRGLVPSWDNTARRQLDGWCVLNSSPAAFELWLRELIFQTSRKPKEERVIFVNAWNEWAEGCHLEPDRRYGRAWLQACLAARSIPHHYQGLFGDASEPGSSQIRPQWDGVNAVDLGFISSCSRLDAKDMEGDFRVTLSPGGMPICPSELFWQGELGDEIVTEHHQQLVTPSVSVYSLENVALHGPGWINRNNALLFSKDIYPEYCRESHKIGRLAHSSRHSLNNTQRRHYRRGWHVTHYNCNVYGHWLLEVLPKLLAIRIARAKWPVVADNPIFMPSNFPAFVFDFCAWILPDVPIIRYNPSTTHLLVDRLDLPSWGRDYVINQELIALLDEMQGDNIPDQHDLIYISRRSRSVFRALTNAAELEEIARREGFVVVYPEEYSLGQQMTIFRAAKCVAGEYGSALHNALFCGNDTVVLALNRINSLQSIIARQRQHRIGYILPTSGQAVTYEEGRGIQQYQISNNLFQERLRECVKQVR